MRFGNEDERILFVCCAVLALLVGVASATAGGGASPKASHATAHSTVTTHVTVTATDLKFTLSKRSVPTGTVIFTVKNKGKLSHDFKIAGKKTPRLLPGHSATLRVTFSKKGRYPYLSTVFGQASHGMKGVFSVVAPTLAPTGTPTPTTTPEPTTPVRPTRRSPSTCSTMPCPASSPSLRGRFHRAWSRS